MLMSAGIPLPKCVFGHGFVQASDGRKMSKSLGNVVDPIDIVKKFPIDTIRLYLSNDFIFGNDLPFSTDSLILLHNSVLVKGLGNLVNRGLSLCKKYTDGKIPKQKSYQIEDKTIKGYFNGLPFNINNLIEIGETNITIEKGFAIDKFSKAIVECINNTNKFLADTEPWKIKDEKLLDKKLGILRTALESLYVIALFLKPFTPAVSKRILHALNHDETKLYKLSSNFDNLIPNKQINQMDDVLFDEYNIDGTIVQRNKNKKSNDNRGKKTQKGFNRTDGDQRNEKLNKQKNAKNKKKEEQLRLAAEQKLQESAPVFGLINLKVGLIKKVWDHPEAERLYCEEIDVGEDKVRQIASGLREHYKSDDLLNRKVIVVCNLKPSKLVGFTSQGK